VSSTPLRIYAPQLCVASPDSGSITLLHYDSCFFVSCCIPALFFCNFRFILLFFLLFMGFYLPAMMWSNLVEEIVIGGRPSTAPIWFSALPSLQQPFNHDCCIYRKELFTEFLCICTALCGPGIGLACLWFFWDHRQLPLPTV
jgi:hypothetical protein